MIDIDKEPWYREAAGPPSAKEEVISLWADFQVRSPQPTLEVLEENQIALEVIDFKLTLSPVEENTYQVIDTGGRFDKYPAIAEDYGFFPGETVGRADVFRFVLDHTEESSWQDQIASRVRGRLLSSSKRDSKLFPLALLASRVVEATSLSELVRRFVEFLLYDDRSLAAEFEEEVRKEFTHRGIEDNPLLEPEKLRNLWKRFVKRYDLSEKLEEAVLERLKFYEPIQPTKESSNKFLLEDKRSRNKPNRKKLKVKDFQPHFGVGPTYYGIVDESCGSWLKDHEYDSEEEAKKALRKCKRSKTPLEFRGF